VSQNTGARSFWRRSSGDRASEKDVKTMARIALVLGLAVMIALVVREGALSIASLLSHAGWLLLLLVPLHAVPLLLDVMGWRLLIPGPSRVGVLFLIASIREAINRLLPVANIGGELVGVQLLTRAGIGATTAATSVIVEVLLFLFAQYLFLTLGIACLLNITGSIAATGTLLIAVAGGLPVILLLTWLLRSGLLVSAIERMASKMLASKGPSSVMSRLALLDTTIRELTSARARLARTLVWQLAALLGGCSETWLALRWLGHPLSLAGALVLESFTVAARSLIFVAPAGLGVQEAGLVSVGHVLGLGSDVALALSLAKRMREILFGLPALAAWQWMTRR
jgi:putative membrane protein